MPPLARGGQEGKTIVPRELRCICLLCASQSPHETARFLCTQQQHEHGTEHGHNEDSGASIFVSFCSHFRMGRALGWSPLLIKHHFQRMRRPTTTTTMCNIMLQRKFRHALSERYNTQFSNSDGDSSSPRSVRSGWDGILAKPSSFEGWKITPAGLLARGEILFPFPAGDFRLPFYTDLREER